MKTACLRTTLLFVFSLVISATAHATSPRVAVGDISGDGTPDGKPSTQTPKNVKAGEKPAPRMLLLPAVQKAHDGKPDPKPAPKNVKSGQQQKKTGLLLPAVQNVKATSNPQAKKKGKIEGEFKVEKGEK